MKCFTVHQPRATLLALGEKQFETRTWLTGYTDPVVIHAGRTFNFDDIRLCREESFAAARRLHGVRIWENHLLPADLGLYFGRESEK